MGSAWKSEKVTGTTPTNAMIWSGGPGIFAANAQAGADTFNSGAISLEMCPNNSTDADDWVPVGTTADGLAELSENGSVGFNAPRDWYLRAKGDAADMSVRWAAESATEARH